MLTAMAEVVIVASLIYTDSNKSSDVQDHSFREFLLLGGLLPK